MAPYPLTPSILNVSIQRWKSDYPAAWIHGVPLSPDVLIWVAFWSRKDPRVSAKQRIGETDDGEEIQFPS